MKKIFNTINKFMIEISEDNINAHAAASAFYMFLSLVPFVALLTAIIPYTGLSQETLFNAVERYMPDALQAIIESVVTDIYFAPGAVLPLSILFTIWLSSRAFFTLIRGIEDIFHSPKYSSFFRRTIIACFYTVGMIAFAIIVLALMVFSKEIYDLINTHLPAVSPALSLLLELRFVVAFLMLAIVFLAIYKGIPGVKIKLLHLMPGAAAAAGAWLLFTWLFSLFIRYANYSTYGSLATIVISLLWMYWCMYIILLGASINQFIREAHEE